VEIAEKDAVLGIDGGSYVGLLSHSGSRALGANIANHYYKDRKTKKTFAG
jgi:tRNA-splicing ligase RtcB